MTSSGEWAGATKRAPAPPPHLALARAARARSRPAIHELRVGQVERLTADAVAITFDVPPHLRDAYRFKAGQHLTVLWEQDGTEVRRSYSLCVGADSDVPKIAVKKVEGGAFSTHATERLGSGDRLRVMTPTGTFTVAPRADRATTYAALAAGSGITPILSIVETLLQAEPLSRVLLLYQNRTPASAMFLAELARLVNDNPRRLVVRYVWSRNPGNCPGAVGRLDRAAIDRLLDEVDEHDVSLLDVRQWLMCGPSELMDVAAAALRDRGAAPDGIRREVFFDPHGDDADAGSELPLVSSRVTVRVGGDELQFSLSSRGESVLARASALMPDIPYSCQDGVCATCRAKVLDGRAVMTRCSGLDRREQEAGYVLTCQAHPVTPTLLLDFNA